MDIMIPLHPIRDERGMTLIELLVVIVILGLLAGLVGPKLFGNVDKAKFETTKTQIVLLEGALDQYRLDMGRYPTSSEGLKALVTNPGSDKWHGPYLKNSTLPLDGWEKPFVYTSPFQPGEYEILSYGQDGVAGGDGYNKDITNHDSR